MNYFRFLKINEIRSQGQYFLLYESFFLGFYQDNFRKDTYIY